MKTPEITGQLFFREAAGKDENGREFRTKDGRKLMMVCGIVAVPEDAPIKPEHQHTVVGNMPYLIVTGEAIDRTEMARGNSIEGLLTQAIWRH